MRFVPVKSPAQQSVLVLHRMRTGFVQERTALVNRLRGLLAEFGVFLPQRIGQLRTHFVDKVEDGNNELAGPARIHYTPVDSSATVSTPSDSSQSARALRSSVIALLLPFTNGLTYCGVIKVKSMTAYAKQPQS